MAPSVATVIAAAKSKLGAKYVWGAEGPNTFDCSGLMVWAWEKVGVKLPRTSQQQARFGTAVPLSQVQPGDLITSNWGGGPSSHVGMYIGDNKMIHAPRPGSVVKIANLDANYRAHINTVRRVPGANAAGITPALDGSDLLDLGGIIAGPNTILAPLKAMAQGTVSLARSMLTVGEFATFLLKLALPTTWVRITSGILGMMFLLLGLGFLIHETRGA